MRKKQEENSFKLPPDKWMLVTTFGGGGCCGCNHLIATALLVCDMKQSSNLRVHTVFHTCVKSPIVFLNPDQIMKAYISINYSLLHVSAPVLFYVPVFLYMM